MVQDQGIKLQLPSAESVTKESKGLIISVHSKKNIKFKRKLIDLQQIKELISLELEEDSATQVIINADKSLPYEFVMSILDKVRLGGCFNVLLQATKID